MPAADLACWIEKAARSEQPHHRRGAASALLPLEPAGHENLLRRLTADPDAEVRLAALTALNQRLRERPDRRATAFRVRGVSRAAWSDLLVSAWGLFSMAPGGRVELRAFDRGEVVGLWPFKAGHTAAAPSGRVAAFAADDGSVWILRRPVVGETTPSSMTAARALIRHATR